MPVIGQKKYGKVRYILFSIAAFIAFGVTSQAEEERKHEMEARTPSKIPESTPRVKREPLQLENPRGKAQIPSGATHNDVINRERNHDHHQMVPAHPQGIQKHRADVHDHRKVVREHHEFHEHDVHRFNHEELTRWRGGRWNNACYRGRCGWWWFAGGQWYFYDRPIYPYPLEVSVVTYVEPIEEAPVVAVPTAPVVQPEPEPTPAFAAQQQQQVWYFCAAANAYYPYVSSCPSGWQTVPATSPPNIPSKQSDVPPH